MDVELACLQEGHRQRSVAGTAESTGGENRASLRSRVLPTSESFAPSSYLGVMHHVSQGLQESRPKDSTLSMMPSNG